MKIPTLPRRRDDRSVKCFVVSCLFLEAVYYYTSCREQNTYTGCSPLPVWFVHEIRYCTHYIETVVESNKMLIMIIVSARNGIVCGGVGLKSEKQVDWKQTRISWNCITKDFRDDHENKHGVLIIFNNNETRIIFFV